MRKPTRPLSLVAIGVVPVAGLLGVLAASATAHATSAGDAFLAASAPVAAASLRRSPTRRGPPR